MVSCATKTGYKNINHFSGKCEQYSHIQFCLYNFYIFCNGFIGFIKEKAA